MPGLFIQYGNITGIRGMSGSFTRGVTPSVFTLYCSPQDVDQSPADLSFGTSSTITLQNCVVGSCHLRSNGVYAVHVQDRRWRWKFSVASGNYNVRGADGIVDPATQKTPAELAALLLQTMGESGFDVSKMPGSVRPRALWKSQRADLLLQELCDYVACEVVLNWQTNKVEIWPLGVGATTPVDQIPKYRHIPRSNVPGTIEVQCGPSLWQSRLKLAAVAKNYTDSKQKKNDSLEYVPAAGWAAESPFSFATLGSTSQPLAFEELWRDYRIIGQQDGTTQPANCQEPVSAIDQYVLNDYVLDTETDLEGYKRNLPCYIDGDYWSYADLPNNVSSQKYTGSFRLFQDRRLVNFPFPMFKLSSTGTYAEPTLYLTTSYKIESTGGELVALYRTGGASGSGKLILRRPEIFSTYSTSTVPGMNTNTQAQATTEADAYITAFQQKYANPYASEAHYPGFSPYTLDGNIAQIKWEGGIAMIPSTTVCENEELDAFSLGRNERRRREKLEAL